MTIDEKIAVLQAYRSGKLIQVIGCPDRELTLNYPAWTDIGEPKFNFSFYSYRVKPEPPKPREWRLYESDEPGSMMEAYPVGPFGFPNGIHVREVL